MILAIVWLIISVIFYYFACVGWERGPKEEPKPKFVTSLLWPYILIKLIIMFTNRK